MKFTSDVKKKVEIASRSESTVLILGPTGSGKTTLARWIHDHGERRLKPFVTVNLASLHEGTLESELFGHERGAYTGADQKRSGRLEAAQGGTVFLDEIGELTPRLQARLLEFLQSRVITPVGGNREIKLDVRVICATHRDLSAAVKRNEFREDLFHRIRVLGLSMKSLLDRADEFDGILHDCLQKLCESTGRELFKISEEVADRLENYTWPGNFRELRNVLEYAVQSSESSTLELSDLPDWFLNSFVDQNQNLNFPEITIQPSLNSPGVMAVAEVPMTLNYEATRCAFEKAYLEYTLKRFGGRISLTARQIGLNKTTLMRRIHAFGIVAATN
ncbi:MAG: sigma-54-dependent Fis family transcriptional regulator [Methylotenera sp.]|nr:sigma-54-dependent Fis family transcriptional regulator [Oligoflexia bacterium]